jgi:hypothetical protein
MVLSNAERQARHRERQREREAYERELLQQQLAEIEAALNEARRALDLPEVQISKSAYDPHR